MGEEGFRDASDSDSGLGHIEASGPHVVCMKYPTLIRAKQVFSHDDSRSALGLYGLEALQHVSPPSVCCKMLNVARSYFQGHLLILAETFQAEVGIERLKN